MEFDDVRAFVSIVDTVGEPSGTRFVTDMLKLEHGRKG